ncbi:hypothetical protein [Treponema endosymbiont of Eucomonympha sp.]|uniref:hypothetical protein n=1 Tax=Treponema endosymbiont of Eucomonympha sp. TaxID=1580831 RepID=UPI0013967677|nr:hypothetical protein [Treponema endosymbiont of Eucomonympha sp.]
MQSSPLPSSPPFMSGVCSSTFKSTLPKVLPLSAAVFASQSKVNSGNTLPSSFSCIFASSMRRTVCRICSGSKVVFPAASGFGMNGESFAARFRTSRAKRASSRFSCIGSMMRAFFILTVSAMGRTMRLSPLSSRRRALTLISSELSSRKRSKEAAYQSNASSPSI